MVKCTDRSYLKLTMTTRKDKLYINANWVKYFNYEAILTLIFSRFGSYNIMLWLTSFRSYA
jgi:hypothetical protein